MKRPQAALAAALALALAQGALAQPLDCFPMCPPPAQEAPAPALNVCAHAAVREVARVDRELAPVKRIYAIATNPTGFALQQVSEHVVRIPPWVGIALDPRGYVRGKVIERVRLEAKKAIGAGKDCADEIAAEDAAA
jgi:hypothetical protein